MVSAAANDLLGHHLHLLHLYVEEQSQVMLVRHLTRKEAMLGETCDEGGLQWVTIISLNFKSKIENMGRSRKKCS